METPPEPNRKSLWPLLVIGLILVCAAVAGIFLLMQEPNKATDTSSDKTTDKTQGKLTIKGQLTPEPDVNSFRHQIVGKTASSLAKIIPVTFPRVYNYALTSNLSPISRFYLPLRWQNISIIIK